MSTGRHAGFASVVSVGADFVNGMLAAAATLAPSPTFALPSVVVVGGQTIGLEVVLSPDVGDREIERPGQFPADPIQGIEPRAAAAVLAPHLLDHYIGI